MSSSLNGIISATSSCGTKPVKEKENPKLALEARLRAAPLLTSSTSSFNWALLDFLMCVFLLVLPPLPLRPGEASLLLDFLDSIPPLPVVSGPPGASLDAAGDFNAAITVSTSWSDLVLSSPEVELDFSIFSICSMQSQNHPQGHKYEIRQAGPDTRS